jgi:chemotaxis protein CheD
VFLDKSLSTETIRTTVIQGEVKIGSGRNEILTTVLGSCIACCLFDPLARIGGMNHFLLAEPHEGSTAALDENYGLFLMELLINKMMKKGAQKSRMKAHIYGGANMHVGMTRIGDANARFARNFLIEEKIELVRCDVGGSAARRVDFDPILGRVRCRLVEQVTVSTTKSTKLAPAGSGDVELF